MKLRLFILLLVSTLALRAAEALPLFNATLTVGKEHRFLLISSVGKSSPWLRLGDAFEGYTLKAFDAKAGALDLDRDGKTARVTLVSDAAVASAPMPTPATLADAAAVLNKMHFDEIMEKAMSRQTKAMTTSVEQSLARLATMPGVNKDELTEFQKKMTDQFAAILDPKQMKTDMTRIYSEMFSKEELDGMSAFYSTPLGEAMAAKLPEVQDKIGGLVQARMAEMVPKVRLMSQEFVAQQRAKAEAAGGAMAPATPAARAPAPVAPAPAAPPAGKR